MYLPPTQRPSTTAPAAPRPRLNRYPQRSGRLALHGLLPIYGSLQEVVIHVAVSDAGHAIRVRGRHRDLLKHVGLVVI